MRHWHTSSAASTLLLVLVLALSVLPCEAADRSDNRHHQLQRSDHHMDDTQADGAIHEIVDATFSAATTGCGLCQQTGYCDHAFKGAPGQFCLTLASGLPCCCPQDAQCAANAYSCRCRRSYRGSPQNGHPVKVVTHTSSTTSDGTKSFSLFSLFAMLLCVGCCVCAFKKRNEQPEYQQPVYAATPQYGATDHQSTAKYPYAYASAPPPDSYGAPYATPYAAPTSTGNTNAYAAGAAGTVAGLAGGMLIGSSFGGGNRADAAATSTTTSYFDGDSGFGNATSNYDFAGDTGDTGDTGDYGGDSGGDFGGDS